MFRASAAAAQLRHMQKNKNCSHLSSSLSMFRSFKTILQSFTSVVGPNGSGKSNVIDAMLFVFGKRAKQVCCTKMCLQRRHGFLLLRQLVLTEMLMLSGLQLRLNKVSELIHNSTNHKNLAMARVCVHFQEILDTVSLR